MNWGMYGILIMFALFILVFIINPNLSCFGRKIKSPFYPLFRKRKIRQAQQKKGEDYGFHLSSDGPNRAAGPRVPGFESQAKKKTEDYGFRLD